MRWSKSTQKLAFVGAFCSGKTTIFNGFKQRFQRDPRFAFVEEAARKLLQNNPFSLTERNSLDVQRKIQKFIIESERKAYATNTDIILCDSSVITTSMYLRGMGNRKGSFELLKAIEFWLPTYDSFLLLDPTDVPYEKDSIRQESEEQRQRNHEAYIELFVQENIPYQLISGTLPERIQKVDTILQEKLR
jgi:HTH-type transcriptional regulator, transcriptional repressor of NAD biosynthesis genes